MEINNRNIIFEIIKNDFETLTKDNQHLLYVVQVLLRKKDGHEKDNIAVYQKSINRIDDYDRVIDTAIKIANEKNGRVYITVSPKNKEAILLRFAQECIMLNVNNSIQNKSIESVIYSVATRSGVSPMPRMIFDFDVIDGESVNCVKTFFDNIFKDTEHKATYLPTVSEFHIICPLNFDYMNDNIINMMDDKFKDIVKNSYMSDNHLNEIPKGTQFKRMFANLMHKELGNTLVYYNKI